MSRLKQGRECVRLASDVLIRQGCLPGYEDTLRSANSLIDIISRSGLDPTRRSRRNLTRARNQLHSFYNYRAIVGSVEPKDIAKTTDYVTRIKNELPRAFARVRGLESSEYAQAIAICDDLNSRLQRDLSAPSASCESDSSRLNKDKQTKDCMTSSIMSSDCSTSR